MLQRDPAGVLAALCQQAGLDFQPQMLTWPAGPKPYDGCWADFWYASVHNSTGFASPAPQRPLPAHFSLLVQDCYPFYMALSPHAIGSRGAVQKPAGGATIEDHGLQMQALPDERNRNVLVWVGAGLVPRQYAAMSVFDSTVQGGDAVWEGGRVYNGRILGLDRHLTRLLNSAKAMHFADIPSREFIQAAIAQTLAANGMRDGVHYRLTLSRGEKTTSSMNPAFNVYGSRLIVLAEWKPIEVGWSEAGRLDGAFAPHFLSTELPLGFLCTPFALQTPMCM